MLIEENKLAGFSLFEMLIAITISSITFMAITLYYRKIVVEILHHYQQYRLEQSIHNAMATLTKDLKRAGFIANHPKKIVEKAITLNNRGDCITIQYDSEIRGKWVYHPTTLQNSDVFSYRYRKNSIEYKTDTFDCNSRNWEKLLDPKEIKVTHFAIQPHRNYTEINLSAELKKSHSINYHYKKVVKHENL